MTWTQGTYRHRWYTPYVVVINGAPEYWYYYRGPYYNPRHLPVVIARGT